jgi:hypothetical protein
VLSWWDLIGNFCSVVLTFNLIDVKLLKKTKKKQKKLAYVVVELVVCLIYMYSTTQVVSRLHATVLGKSCVV